jgi:diguanylate cyclase (GGDEF)-like protein
MKPAVSPGSAPPVWTRAGIAYATALFVLAATLLAICLHRAGGPLAQGQWLPALFFFAFGLFTISVGYRGPNQHYTSFDRVAQVASILVLGPLDAAWINGLASLLYPLHRVWLGIPLRTALFAAMTNSGIMSLIVLASGWAYLQTGGVVPLTNLDAGSIIALLVLVLLMQLLNDVLMLVLTLLSGRSARGAFSGFSYALEVCSGAAAVLVALVYNRLELAAFALLLLVLGICMLALRRFAVMHFRLEGIVEERTQSLRQKSLELEQQATRDNLTSLFNRRYADAWLAQQLQLAQRQPQQQLVVALADIDHFKQVNDQHSHATGDEVLRRVAATLQQNCRAGDMVARYGGEEFLFCFPRTAPGEAAAICEALRAAVARSNWSDLELVAPVTLSFGLAAREQGMSLDALLRQADQRLYAAKNGGRNRVIA